MSRGKTDAPEAQRARACLPLSGRVGPVAALRLAVAEQDRSEGIAVCSMPTLSPGFVTRQQDLGSPESVWFRASNRPGRCGIGLGLLRSKRRPMEPEVGKGIRSSLLGRRGIGRHDLREESGRGW